MSRNMIYALLVMVLSFVAWLTRRELKSGKDESYLYIGKAAHEMLKDKGHRIDTASALRWQSYANDYLQARLDEVRNNPEQKS